MKEKDYVTKRLDSLVSNSDIISVRYSYKNKDIKQLYDSFLKEPLGELSEILLHTSYSSKAKDYGYIKEKIMELKGSKTEKNLMEAFAGESQARNKYSFYASRATKDGYNEISSIFDETANNEKEHAKLWFKALHGGSVADTYTNLLDAAAGEHGEWTDMYERMAKEAKEEGFMDLSAQFAGVAKIEKAHEERYLKLAKAVKENRVFVREGEVVWKCLNCGHLHVGEKAPMECPVCAHPQAYFVEVK